MKVGVLLTGAVPSDGGGYSYQRETFEALCRVAGESSHRFVVIDSCPEATRPAAPPNVEFPIALPSIVYRALRRAQPLWIDWYAKRLGIDAVWCLTPFHPVMDTPYVTTVWDLQHRRQPFFPEVSAGGQWDLRDRAFRARVRRAAAIITGTQAGKSEVVSFYQVSEDRVRILPHPTPGFALNAPPAPDGGRDLLKARGIEPGYLYYPAQFWPHKNHVNLLLALQLLRERHGLNLPLVLSGSDAAATGFGTVGHIKRLVSDLGLSDQVHMLGFVSQAELIALYRNALALVYPTFFGPENLPPLEAFALGCPVVASNVAGSEEQLGDAAVLFDPSDPAAIADAVKRVHDDPKLRDEMRARGEKRARRCTGEDYVRGVFKVLDELAAVIRCWQTA